MTKFQNDLTQGGVAKNLIRFSLPFLAANLLQAMYSLCDMVVVGNYNGPVGASAVGVGGQITILVLNIIAGLAIGGTVVIAQTLGAKQDSLLPKTLGTIFSQYAIAAVVFTGLMFALNSVILRALTDDQDVYDEAIKYVNICTAGNIFTFGYNAVSAVLRGMGDSKHPLMFVGIAAAANVILDILLVGPFDMGAAGAAWATIAAQALSFILAVIFLKKKNFLFDFRLKSFKIDKTISKNILKIGLPASVQGMLATLSFMVLTSVANTVADVAGTTAVSVAGRFNAVAILPAFALQMSVSSIAGQNFGAKKPQRAFRTMLAAIAITFAISLVMYIAANVFPEQIVSLFIGSDAGTLTEEQRQLCLKESAVYLKHMSLDYLVVSFVFNIGGLAMAAGHTWFSLLTGIISSLAFRIPAAILLGITLDMGMAGLGYAAPIASLGALVLGIVYLASGVWKKGGKVSSIILDV
ncbi:MAG: MATE family efflux transporter [Clostridiales bacterium]|nr:MATE family efflux transporter [Clostridiales bacterium]